MGNILYEYIKEKHAIFLNKKSFVKGNYSPDFSTSMITRPHYIKNNLGHVQKEIEALSNIKLKSAFIDKEYSKRLGIICHYCADFFCFAHSIYFKESMKAHIKYERRLHKYFVSRLSLIKNIRFMLKKDNSINVDKINLIIDRYQSDYLYSSNAYSKDLIYSMQVCVEIIVSLVNCSYALNSYKKTNRHL